MPKFRFDRKAVGGFFVSHFEKFILAGVMALFGVFVYSGLGVEGLEDGKSPEHLVKHVDQARSIIESDTWSGPDGIAKDFVPETGLEQKVRRTQADDTNDTGYVSTKPYLPSTKPSGIKREDPELVAPTDVEATVVVASLAYEAGENDFDMLADLENTEMKIIKKRKRRKKARSMDEMTDDEMAAMFGMGEAAPVDDTMASGGGAEVDPEDENAATAADRAFPGFRPKGEATSKSKTMVAVKAIVPYRQQWDAYEQTLADAMHYFPGRDAPKYVMFIAQRAEVSDDPDAELKWTPLTWTRRYDARIQLEKFVGLGSEVADPRYVSENLTMPIPPIMMRKFTEFALHSKVPRLMDDEAADTVDEAAAEAEEAERLRAIMESDVLMPGMGAKPKPAGGMGGFGLGEMGGMASAGRSSAASRSAGPQVDYLLVRFFDFDAKPGKRYRYRIQVALEDPNYPEIPGHAPADRALSDDVKTRLAEVQKSEQAQAARNPGFRQFWRTTEWSEPSDIVYIAPPAQTFAGQVDATKPLKVPGSAVTVLSPTEQTAKVLSIVWDRTHSVDVPTYIDATRGTVLNFKQDADIVHPVTLQFKKLEDFEVSTGRMLVDFRGGEELPSVELKTEEEPRKRGEKKKDEDEKEPEKIFAASEFIFLDADGNFFVRNDLDDLKTFELYTVPEKVEEE